MVSVLAYGPHTPEIDPSAFVAAGARLIGELTVGQHASIWFNAVLRADLAPIRVGAGSNVQDNAVVHVASSPQRPTIIGKDVTIGHSAIIHACTIEDLCLIGMGACVLDGAFIGQGSIVGAHALVTQGKHFPPGSLILGRPAVRVKSVTPTQMAELKRSAHLYQQLAQTYRNAP